MNKPNASNPDKPGKRRSSRHSNEPLNATGHGDQPPRFAKDAVQAMALLVQAKHLVGSDWVRELANLL